MKIKSGLTKALVIPRRRLAEGKASDQLAKDILSVAAEGGINYWADSMKGTQFPTKIHDSEEDKWYDLTREKFDTGLALFLQKGQPSSGSSRFSANMLGSEESEEEIDFDAGDADAIIQYALFGDVIYG